MTFVIATGGGASRAYVRACPPEVGLEYRDLSQALRFATAADADTYLTAVHEQRQTVEQALGTPHVDGPLIGTFRRIDLRNGLGQVMGQSTRVHDVINLGDL